MNSAVWLHVKPVLQLKNVFPEYHKHIASHFKAESEMPTAQYRPMQARTKELANRIYVPAAKLIFGLWNELKFC